MISLNKLMDSFNLFQLASKLFASGTFPVTLPVFPK